MSDCGCSVELESEGQRRVLIALLMINGLMFVVEVVIGLVAESSGLIADSLDMLADAMVYGVALYAVGAPLRAKVRAAYLSGVFQLALAVGVAVEIARRVIWGSSPEPILMVVISIVALAANVLCLVLISRHRESGVHMRASWIFSRNDVIANGGVILAGLLVYLLGSRWPDLVIGSMIVLIVWRGGTAILFDARHEQASISAPSTRWWS